MQPRALNGLATQRGSPAARSGRGRRHGRQDALRNNARAWISLRLVRLAGPELTPMTLLGDFFPGLMGMIPMKS